MRAARFGIFILVLLGLVLLVILLFRSVFNTNNSTTNPRDIPALATYADTNAQASMVVDGPIVSAQEHTAVRITVDRTQSLIEVMRGYDGQVVAQQAFPGSEAAYLQFLSALDRLGFTKGNADPKLQDSAGSCPFGNTYTYRLTNGSDEIVNYWTTSCSGGGGTYQGSRSETHQLFLRQIPPADLTRLTRNVAI